MSMLFPKKRNKVSRPALGKILKSNVFKIINPCHFSEKYNNLLEFAEKLLMYERNLENRLFLKENLDVLRDFEKSKKKGRATGRQGDKNKDLIT